MSEEPESRAGAAEATLLAESPAVFGAALLDLGEAKFARRPTPDEWSPLEILRHVRASDLIVASRIWNVLTRPDGVHLGLDERKYGDLLARADVSAADQVQAFVLRRRELVGLLRGTLVAVNGPLRSRRTLARSRYCDLLATWRRMSKSTWGSLLRQSTPSAPRPHPRARAVGLVSDLEGAMPAIELRARYQP